MCKQSNSWAEAEGMGLPQLLVGPSVCGEGQVIEAWEAGP